MRRLRTAWVLVALGLGVAAVFLLVAVLAGGKGDRPRVSDERTCAVVQREAVEHLEELEAEGIDPQQDQRQLELNSEMIDACS